MTEKENKFLIALRNSWTLTDFDVEVNGSMVQIETRSACVPPDYPTLVVCERGYYEACRSMNALMKKEYHKTNESPEPW